MEPAIVHTLLHFHEFQPALFTLDVFFFFASPLSTALCRYVHGNRSDFYVNSKCCS